MKIFALKKKQKTVLVTLKNQPTWHKRPLTQALFFSFLFHLIVFSIFDVHMTQVHDPIESLAPTAVSLAQKLNSTTPITEAETPSLLEKNSLLTAAINKAPFYFLYKKPHAVLPLTSLLTYTPIIDEESPNIPLTPKPIIQKHPFYPVKLAFSKNIAALDLIDDGNALFASNFRPSFLTTTTYFCKYQVKILGSTGKIIRYRVKKTTLDDEMQKHANHLLETFSFFPVTRRWIKGTITVTFLRTKETFKQVFHKNPKE